jgi:hypothetical protein
VRPGWGCPRSAPPRSRRGATTLSAGPRCNSGRAHCPPRQCLPQADRSCSAPTGGHDIAACQSVKTNLPANAAHGSRSSMGHNGLPTHPRRPAGGDSESGLAPSPRQQQTGPRPVLTGTPGGVRQAAASAASPCSTGAAEPAGRSRTVEPVTICRPRGRQDRTVAEQGIAAAQWAGRDSNPHPAEAGRDFKSLASADSATGPLLRLRHPHECPPASPPS